MKPSNDARRIEARWRAITAKVEADAPCLLRQGALIGKRARGRLVWVLRYRARHGGKHVHRSIYLGADERGLLRERVCELLESYRRQGRWLRQLPALARLAAKLSALGRRQAKRA
jgi:hypothetical protein